MNDFPPGEWWSGLPSAAQPVLAYGLGRSRQPARQVVLTTGMNEAFRVWRSLQWCADQERKGRPECILLPETATVEGDDHPDWQRALDRTAALVALMEAKRVTAARPIYLVTTPKALSAPTTPPEVMFSQTRFLQSGTDVPFDDLVAGLVKLEYESVANVEHPCQFAVRGGILDIYPAGALGPVRLDFFGDELEEIHTFDPVTQRSEEKLSVVAIPPSPIAERQTMSGYGLDWVGEAAAWFWLEPTTLEESLSALSRDHPEARRLAAAWAAIRRKGRHFALGEIATTSHFFPPETPIEEVGAISLELLAELHQSSESIARERLMAEESRREHFLQQLDQWRQEGSRIVFTLPSEGEEDRLREILRENPRFQQLEKKSLYTRSLLAEGFRLESPAAEPLEGLFGKGRHPLVVVTETELFGRNRRRSLAPTGRREWHHAEVDQLLDFAELVEGDYLVHLQHGICRFRGLGPMDAGGTTQEMISLEFEDGIALHVPLRESHLLTRYVGLTRVRPALARLGSGRWEKVRAEAERATLDFAAEMLRIQALRDSGEGFAHPPDTAWQREFEGAFPFTETSGQRQAIADCKQDLEKPRPMDRLLCGDVGFGKTEVALRAAFKVVMGGKQVAILAPTTVLVQQHWENFCNRLAEYPIVVEMLSRFRNASQVKTIRQSLREGKIDILIGTHRLLSKDIHFKDLGLVVIDEEHRFGTRHKERIKAMRTMVDVLTMSATPIPRTMHLALSGARDLSVIETPPVNRLPIRTIVKTFDLELVRQAIRFEVERGGQVFYLHNRVDTISTLTFRLQELMPEIRFITGHGQMKENELEKVMQDFTAHRYDVLVCTTIIESGIDIPNCNTLIVEAADRFGLSQLYQLRGRVGRFTQQAYAYLLLHRHGRVLEQARKRLAVLRHYNQLGSGFRIAMRDLELRGAGNLLGTKQSGHIAGVGFDLYCQLLRQSIARLKGEGPIHRVRAKVNLDFVFTGEAPGSGTETPDRFKALKASEEIGDRGQLIEAAIPAVYLTETRLRLDFYRRLALLEEHTKVREIREEMEDRFGPVPDETKALLWVTAIRCLAESKGIASVESERDRLICQRGNPSPGEFVKFGSRFPRLTEPAPLDRLKEIAQFLQRLDMPCPL